MDDPPSQRCEPVPARQIRLPSRSARMPSIPVRLDRELDVWVSEVDARDEPAAHADLVLRYRRGQSPPPELSPQPGLEGPPLQLRLAARTDQLPEDQRPRPAPSPTPAKS